MDNNPAGLPPLAPLPQPTAPAQPLYAPPPGVTVPPRSMGVPGRPSNDPEQQAARAEKSRDQQRLLSLTPTRATDHKLHVYRTDGNGRVRGSKPVLVLLSTEIERKLGANSPTDPDTANQLDDLITEQLPASAANGVYKCQWYDKTGRAVQDPPAWELTVGDPVDDDEQGGDGAFEEDEDPVVPQFMPVQQSFAPAPPAPTPPPAPAMDISTVSSVMREERREESKRGNETMTLIVSMQQQSQQQMAVMMQMQQAQQLAQQQMAQQSEERDRQRRSESRQTMMAMIPMVLPIIQQMFSPKDKGPSPEMTVLIEMMKANLTNKSSDTVMFENMMKLNGEMTRQAMELQASGASASAAMQAEATAAVFKNLMNTLKETMEMKTTPKADAEESTLSQIAKIAGPLIAAAQQQNQPQAPQPDAPAPAQPAPAPRPAQQPTQKQQPPAAAPAAPVRTSTRRPAANPAAPGKPSANPADYSDSRRIGACMNAVRRMSLGELPPEQRWNVIDYLTRWLPAPLIEAIKAKDKDKVTLLASDVVLANATLLGWITDEENRDFLTDALEDVRLLVTNTATEAHAAASVAKAQAFLARRRAQIQNQRVAQDAATAAHNNPEETVPSTPPVSATLATETPAATTPPVSAEPVPPPAKRPSGKIPPPSAP